VSWPGFDKVKLHCSCAPPGGMLYALACVTSPPHFWILSTDYAP